MLVVHPPGARELVPVEAVDPAGRLLEGSPERFRDVGFGLRPLRRRHPELVDPEADPVEALRQLDDRRVPVPANVLDDLCNAAPHLPHRRLRGTGEGGHDAIHPQLGSAEPPDHRATPALRSSRSRLTAWYAVLCAARFTISRAVDV